MNHYAMATEQSEMPSLEILQSEWSMHSHAFIISLCMETTAWLKSSPGSS